MMTSHALSVQNTLKIFACALDARKFSLRKTSKNRENCRLPLLARPKIGRFCQSKFCRPPLWKNSCGRLWKHRLCLLLSYMNEQVDCQKNNLCSLRAYVRVFWCIRSWNFPCCDDFFEQNVVWRHSWKNWYHDTAVIVASLHNKQPKRHRSAAVSSSSCRFKYENRRCWGYSRLSELWCWTNCCSNYNFRMLDLLSKFLKLGERTLISWNAINQTHFWFKFWP